jgi:MOSC domain-containing protein YiiM
MRWIKKAEGKIEGLFSTPDVNSFETTPRESLNFTLEGIPGDRHAGFFRASGGREKKEYHPGTVIRNNRQWSALSVEELQMIAERMQLNELNAGLTGANLLISGLSDFTHTPSLSLLKINGDQGAVLVVYGENKPCLHPHKLMEERTGKKIETPFTKAAASCRGLVGWVEKAGEARIGDAVELFIPESNL